MDTQSTKETAAPEPIFMTKTQVLELLNLSESTVARHVKSGILPRPFYLRRRPMWNRAELLAAVEALPREAQR